MVTDRVSGYSKGFGFVRYATLEDAEAGIKGMDGQVSCDTTPEYIFFHLRKIYLIALMLV